MIGREIGTMDGTPVRVIDGKVWKGDESLGDYFEFCIAIRKGEQPSFVGAESFHL